MNIKYIFTFLFINIHDICGYRTSHSFQTRFTSKNDIDNFICSSKFYDEYFKLVDAVDIDMEDPLYNNYYDMITVPHRLTYYSKPNIPYLPKFFPRIKIEQYWCKDEFDYFGHIKTKYIEFGLVVEPIQNNESQFYSLYIEGTIFKKYKKIIPNKCLDYLLKDFGENFNEISNILQP